MIDWSLVWHDYLGITWSGLLGIVVSAIVLYAFFTLLVQAVGPRLMARPSAGSFVVLAVIGGITARATLGESPTMLGALVVLSILVLPEWTTGRLRGVPPLIRRSRPVVVLVDGEIVPAALRRAHLTRRELLDRLRVGGVRELSQVSLVILEVRGSLTIVPRGARIERALVENVEGIGGVPDELLAG
jgi:uncharacterized membrane protein YcaP (DUF421 family)